jgi:hypothetical protein
MGLWKKIDTYMFEEVCKLLQKWKKEMDQLTNMIISVNFSRAPPGKYVIAGGIAGHCQSLSHRSEDD